MKKEEVNANVNIEGFKVEPLTQKLTEISFNLPIYALTKVNGTKLVDMAQAQIIVDNTVADFASRNKLYFTGVVEVVYKNGRYTTDNDDTEGTMKGILITDKPVYDNEKRTDDIRVFGVFGVGKTGYWWTYNMYHYLPIVRASINEIKSWSWSEQDYAANLYRNANADQTTHFIGNGKLLTVSTETQTKIFAIPTYNSSQSWDKSPLGAGYINPVNIW